MSRRQVIVLAKVFSEGSSDDSGLECCQYCTFSINTASNYTDYKAVYLLVNVEMYISFHPQVQLTLKGLELCHGSLHVDPLEVGQESCEGGGH